MKRLVALLSCICVLLAVCGTAGALELPYADRSSIRNPDAVFMLTDLGLLEGDGGRFFPDGKLTRAEVAKIAALVISSDPQPAGKAPFSDLGRCWAADYIAFCYERGFLAGQGDGSFAPNEAITARELVKMLLGAIGYDLTSYAGPGWEARLDTLADSLHIYNGYELSRSKPITRDYAALLILNVLNCSAIAGYEDGEPVPVVDSLLNPVTVLEARFGVVRYQQVITANEYADLENPGHPLAANTTKLYGHYAMDFHSGLDALGRTVTVYLRDGQPIGVPVYNPEEFCVTVSGRDALDTLFQSGGYAPAEDVRIFDNGAAAGLDALYQLSGTDTATLIDYESDDIIDLILIWRWQEYEVVQGSPLVIVTGEGNQVFPSLSTAADEVSAMQINGSWVVSPF